MLFLRRVGATLGYHKKMGKAYPNYLVSRWAKHHRIFTICYDDWAAFVKQQWPRHLSSAQRCLQYRDVKFLRELFSRLVLHGRDHAVHHTHAYCPRLYWTVLKHTFDDPQVYTPAQIPPASAVEFLKQLAKTTVAKRYSWGMSMTAPLPTSYILLKKKKHFLSARPIISYSGFMFEQLFKALAMILRAMLHESFPLSLGLDAMPRIFERLHTFLDQAADDSDLQISNQDLIGFFPSIPTDRIITAVQKLVKNYKQLHPHSEWFTVQLREKNTTLRVFRGRRRQPATLTRQVRISDIVDLCRLSLQASIFQQMGRTFRQVRGSAIGNQVSPILADVAVSFCEQRWGKEHLPAIQASGLDFFATRYVDNRLVVYDHRLASRVELQLLLHDHFYQLPVELEQVSSGEFLGTAILVPQFQLTFQQPREDWQFRHSLSAGSTAQHFAAVRSRMCMIAGYTFPSDQTCQDMITLIQTYERRGFSAHELIPLAKKFLGPRLAKQFCNSQWVGAILSSRRRGRHQ